MASVLSTGGLHACGILDTSDLACWGYNGAGQLGVGDSDARGDEPGELGGAIDLVDLGTGRTPVSVSAGFLHTCALLDNATVKCWGDGADGRTGQGAPADLGDDPDEMGDDLPVVDLGTGRTALAISAGGSHTCVILDDSTVKCWGDGQFGKTGHGAAADLGDDPDEMGDDLPVVDLGTGRTALAISAGGSHTCVILDDSTVKCWGSNGSGQLGYGHTDHLGDDSDEMGDNLPSVDLGTGRTALAISAGESHTCVILDDNTLKCWGNNTNGRLGYGHTDHLGDDSDEMGDNLPSVDLGTGRTPLAVSAGDSHTCSLVDTNTVKCWGEALSGQLGIGDEITRGDKPGDMGDDLPAVDLGAGRTAQFVTTGHDISCAMLDNNSVKCWGANAHGQLGQGDDAIRGDDGPETGDDLPTVDLGTTDTPVALMTGDSHVCVHFEATDDYLKCWGASSGVGSGASENLGDDPDEMSTNLPTVDLGTAVEPFRIEAGDFTSCAILTNFTLKCWGANTYGELGQNSTDTLGDDPAEMGDNLAAIDLGTGRHATRVTASNDHTCALLDNATVKCWGMNFSTYGHLGLELGITDHQGDGLDPADTPVDEMGDSLPAIDLGTGRTAIAIDTGVSHTCAILDDATVKCWGSNFYGQLGQGNKTTVGSGANQMGDNLAAIDLGTGRTAAQIAVGENHTCVILDNDDLKCWGQGTSGQLGQGSTATKGDAANEMGDLLPVTDLGTGRTAEAITAGKFHTCAILDNATVKCWGGGLYGQLGNGDDGALGGSISSMGDNLPVVDLGTGRTAVAISAGEQFTCAILDNDTVKCWGFNNNGQLGLGHTSPMGNGSPEMGDLLPPIDGVVLASLMSPPAQPAAPTASVNDTTATVVWVAPGDDGGSAITSYLLQSSTDGVIWTDEATTSDLTTDVVDLVGGQPVWFRVIAVNAEGDSPPSQASSSVSATTTTTSTTTTTTTTTSTTTTTTTVAPPPPFDPCPPGGHPFTDVPESSFAYDDIGCIYQLDITTGTSDTTYSPTNPVTREQMGAFLARLWRKLGNTCPTGNHPFTDVPESSFAYDDIGCIYQLDITTGTSDTTYSPTNPVTREQMGAFLARLWRKLGNTCPTGNHPFTDVPESSFAYDDIGCIYQLDITTGTSDTTYSPTNPVTREQMGAFLARLTRKAADQL